jgi:hypothetical protein
MRFNRILNYIWELTLTDETSVVSINTTFKYIAMTIHAPDFSFSKKKRRESGSQIYLCLNSEFCVKQNCVCIFTEGRFLHRTRITVREKAKIVRHIGTQRQNICVFCKFTSFNL